VELTNTRRRWSGVWITTSARILRSLIVPGRPRQVWNEPARAGNLPSFILRRYRFDAEVGGVLAGESVGVACLEQQTPIPGDSFHGPPLVGAMVALRRLLEPIGNIPPAEFEAIYSGREDPSHTSGLNQPSLR